MYNVYAGEAIESLKKTKDFEKKWIFPKKSKEFCDLKKNA